MKFTIGDVVKTSYGEGIIISPYQNYGGNYWNVSVCHTLYVFHEGQMEIINSKINKNKTMNLIKSFNNIFLKEPEKSFRKAGITGDDGMLTTDGQKVFMTYLLQKNGDTFKTDVVDAILAEEEDK